METRAIRPPDPVEPNDNDPASVPPATVGPPAATPGDPHGVIVDDTPNPGWVPPAILPSPWSGWPGDWWPPLWGQGRTALTNTAWMCVDLNASLLATMPPYLVDAAASLSADWLNNPDPDVYTSWEEFAKQLFWDYQLGEAFVIATAYYATGLPARFHVVPPWLVQVELGRDGLRHYTIGRTNVDREILHIRYQSTVGDARGHGPLEAGELAVIAADVLTRYGSKLAAAGGIPAGVLTYPGEVELTPGQIAAYKAQWMQARASSIGEPALLSGGITWEQSQVNPTEMALVDLLLHYESRICSLLGVPPPVVGLKMIGDSLTYTSVTMLFDQHWRAGLRPKASTVMAALSNWALPRGTRVELNRDAYIEPGPLERAQTAQILNSIRDEQGNPVLSVADIQAAERLTNSTPADLSSGVLR